MGFTFKKEERLCSRQLIDRLYAEGHRLMAFPYSVQWMTLESGERRVESGKSTVLFIDNDGMTAIRPDAQPPLPVLDALAVDAACSGNPGIMEYQGIYIPTRTRVFHYQAPKGTNNIGEFLAIVHGLSYLKKHHLDQIIYSDSVNAMSWVRQKVCKSKLPDDASTAELWDFVHRAEQWLRSNTYTTEIRKWDTDRWGEIPADFGRK